MAAIIARTSQFMHVPEEDVYVAEASDLGLRPGMSPDGVTVINSTGDTARFTIAHREFNRDGDLVWWDLRSETSVTLRIFND